MGQGKVIWQLNMNVWMYGMSAKIGFSSEQAKGLACDPMFYPLLTGTKKHGITWIVNLSSFLWVVACFLHISIVYSLHYC